MPPSRVTAQRNPTRGFPMKGTDGKYINVLGLAGFLLALLLATRAGLAQGAGKEIVADVSVIGNRNIPTEKVMRYIRTRPGGDYLQATLEADVTRLAETRMFKSVRVKDARLGDGRVQVFFEVQEYPNLIREIIYKNANHISEKDLE